MELYLANNNIDDLREVLHLKDLPKLIILDVTGNPISEDPDYRLFCIFHLRRLKVLGGIAVDPAEVTSAKSEYSGKLTLEFVSDRIGHKVLDHVHELDLSGCQLRAVDAISSMNFPALTALNLDNNYLSSLDSLVNVPNLTELTANHNVRLGIEGKPDKDKQRYGGRKPTDVPTVFSWPGTLMASLTVLELGFCSIISMGALSLTKLTSLEVLHLNDNKLTRIDGLDSIHSLRELDVSRNQIRTVDPGDVGGARGLQILHVQENGMRQVPYLADVLPYLQELQLAGNRIGELSEVEKLSECERLEVVSFASNPVCRKPAYRYSTIYRLPQVHVLDNKTVTPEEQERSEAHFAAETAIPPNIVLAPQSHSGPKVAIKMTSLTFDPSAGPSGHDAGPPQVRTTAVPGAPASSEWVNPQGGGVRYDPKAKYGGISMAQRTGRRTTPRSSYR